eukprot:scaffold3184_cov636-Pavlova_lutheri.AAC.2
MGLYSEEIQQHARTAGHGVQNQHCCLGRVFGIGDPGDQHDSTRGGQPRPVPVVGHAHQRHGPAFKRSSGVRGRTSGSATTDPGGHAGSRVESAEGSAQGGQARDQPVESAGPICAVGRVQHVKIGTSVTECFNDLTLALQLQTRSFSEQSVGQTQIAKQDMDPSKASAEDQEDAKEDIKDLAETLAKHGHSLDKMSKSQWADLQRRF